MLRVPTSRKRKKPQEKLNLVPIMDAVFIFIFFLLMSTSFLRIFEIGSDIPIISDSSPPKDKKVPLALTLEIKKNQMILSRGIPSKTLKVFRRSKGEEFDYEEIHKELIEIKKRHVDEETIILVPSEDLSYDEIVKIMDSVRMLRNTDEAIFKKNKDGLEEKIRTLFSKIIFSNLMS